MPSGELVEVCLTCHQQHLSDAASKEGTEGDEATQKEGPGASMENSKGNEVAKSDAVAAGDEVAESEAAPAVSMENIEGEGNEVAKSDAVAKGDKVAEANAREKAQQ